jgi:hypothetical protein
MWPGWNEATSDKAVPDFAALNPSYDLVYWRNTPCAIAPYHDAGP